MVTFIIIFPGHIFYQLTIHAGLFPPLLGGYFTAAALATFPIVFLSIVCATYLRIGIGVALFGGFMLLFGIGVAFGIQKGVTQEITSPQVAFFLKFVCFYLLAATTPWEQKRFQHICRLSTVLLACLIIFCTFHYGMTFTTDVDADNDKQMDYQGMAFAYIVVVLGALQGSGQTVRILIYSLSIPVLFIIGARAEFVGFFVIIALTEYFLARSRIVFMLKMVAVLTLAIYTAFLTQNIIGDNRIFSLLHAGSDESVMERRDLHADALRTIQQHPLLGDYGSYEPGGYAHNLLSAWVDLGLPGFVILNLLFVVALLDMCFKGNARRWGHSLAFSVAMVASAYFLLIVAKAYTYQMIPIALGSYLHMQSRVFRLKTSGIA